MGNIGGARAWGMLKHVENSNIIRPFDNWTTIPNEPHTYSKYVNNSH